MLGIIFLVVGLSFIFYPQLEKKASDREQENLIKAFEQLGQMDLLDEEQVDQEIAVENETELPDVLDGARGVIQIPKIDLEMMIFEGADLATLKKGIGMIEPDKEFNVNNVGLAGHRSLTHGKQFNRLIELKEDDTINVKTKDGIYEYIIVDSFVVHQSEVEVLDDGDDPLLTLVTCTPLGQANPPDRLIVQAKLKM